MPAGPLLTPPMAELVGVDSRYQHAQARVVNHVHGSGHVGSLQSEEREGFGHERVREDELVMLE